VTRASIGSLSAPQLRFSARSQAGRRQPGIILRGGPGLGGREDAGLPVALSRPLGFSCGPAGVGISIATRGRDLDRDARLQRSALSSGVRVVGRPPSRRTPRPPLPPPCLSGRSGTAAISGPVPRKAGSPAGRSSTGDPRTSLWRVASSDSGWRSGPASYGVAPRPMMPPRMSRRGGGNAPTGPGHRVPRRCVHARPASDSRIHARTEHRGASLGPDCTVNAVTRAAIAATQTLRNLEREFFDETSMRSVCRRAASSAATSWVGGSPTGSRSTPQARCARLRSRRRSPSRALRSCPPRAPVAC
jgi:hypothetical protein